MKRSRSFFRIAFCCISILFISATKDQPANQRTVLLELFTSQGCSSCPPADALLGEYAGSGDTHVIPLSFHVDYWNRLGWKDPFSAAAFSARQQQYSRHMHLDGVYTPQIVVNGRTETVGNNRNAVQRLVAQEKNTAADASLTIDGINVSDKALEFHYHISGAAADQLIQVALAQKKLTTDIRAGENSGVVLTNYNVVREFTTVQPNPQQIASVPLPNGFKRQEYVLVVFLQNVKNLTVTAVTAKTF
ncbi:MAG: DUF1223 domain-containing protein [Chitinophagaceae bacterium]|nr:DUF1223 domain-containing protein [Chitinophagaceae bacterium]